MPSNPPAPSSPGPTPTGQPASGGPEAVAAAAPAAAAPAQAQLSVVARLKKCLRGGIRPGLKQALWLLSIMVPVSLAVTIIVWTGVLAYAAKWLNPVFKLLGLPVETVLPVVICVFLSIYQGIAALGSIALTERQVTILAIMMLIAHNFCVEQVVLRKTGTPIWRMTLLRLGAALAGAVLLNWLMPADAGPAKSRVAAAVSAGFWPMLGGWAGGIAKLSGMVIGIVIGLMVLQRILREFALIDKLSKLLAPVLALLGLPQRTAFLWIVANTLGLAYGAAVIIEESEQGRLSRQDAQLLNRSIAVCHSLLEDTLIFAALGAWVFWITIPRLVLAAAVVWGYRIGSYLAARASAAFGRGERRAANSNLPQRTSLSSVEGAQRARRK